MQLSENIFPYVIGYHGETAIIDKKLKNRCKNKPLAVLIEEGYLKVAFCQALFHGDAALQEVTELYNNKIGENYSTEQMKRLLGVFEITQARRIRYI